MFENMDLVNNNRELVICCKVICRQDNKCRYKFDNKSLIKRGGQRIHTGNGMVEMSA